MTVRLGAESVGSGVRRSSVRDMFVLLHGFSYERELALVLWGFYDRSSTHSGTRVSTLCGFLGTFELLNDLEKRWFGVLDKPCWPKRPKEFHAVDCAHGSGEFTDWSFAERLAIFGDLVGVIIESDLIALGSIVIAEDLKKLRSDESELLNSQGLGTPLDLCMQYILQRSIAWTQRHAENQKWTPEIGLIFDIENPEEMERIFAFFNLYKKKHGFGDILRSIGFGPSEKYGPLQAADLLAFGTYRYEMRRRFPEEVEPDFPVLPAFTKMLERIAREGGGYDLEALKKLIAFVKDHPYGQSISI